MKYSYKSLKIVEIYNFYIFVERIVLTNIRMMFFLFVIVPFSVGQIISSSINSNDSYWTHRRILLQNEKNHAIGGNLTLLPEEQMANKILMKLKNDELKRGLNNLSEFMPSHNFMKIKSKINESKLFNVIKSMPKGAVLHAHDTAIVSKDWVYNVTFRDNLYICDSENRFELHFFQKPANDCDWKLLSDHRKSFGNNSYIDKRIKKKISMEVEDPDKSYPDEDSAWKKFDDIFSFTRPLLTYRPVFEDYYYEGLRQLYEDNVMYLEFRSILPTVYELDKTEYNKMEVIEIYMNVTERFKRDYRNFIGAKLIYGPYRVISDAGLDKMIRDINQMKKLFPYFFAGYDLVGHEDKGRLATYADKLMNNINSGIEKYFHAGETNWYGCDIDENLIDAVLLGAKRIGHGFAVVKHPSVKKLMRKKNIAIEICPISNQVLGLVKDLRNHPANILFAENFPVVISNDDPGLWDAKALSYDFYLAFMGLMSKNADIRALKQLAINSITYSSLSIDEQKNAMCLFDNEWNFFIKKLISQ